MWPTCGGTFTHKSASVPGAHKKKGPAKTGPFIIAKGMNYFMQEAYSHSIINESQKALISHTSYSHGMAQCRQKYHQLLLFECPAPTGRAHLLIIRLGGWQRRKRKNEAIFAP